MLGGKLILHPVLSECVFILPKYLLIWLEIFWKVAMSPIWAIISDTKQATFMQDHKVLCEYVTPNCNLTFLKNRFYPNS